MANPGNCKKKRRANGKVRRTRLKMNKRPVRPGHILPNIKQGEGQGMILMSQGGRRA